MVQKNFTWPMAVQETVSSLYKCLATVVVSLLLDAKSILSLLISSFSRTRTFIMVQTSIIAAACVLGAALVHGMDQGPRSSLTGH